MTAALVTGERPRIVFLFDVDNTLLNNDQVQSDLSAHLEQGYGHAARVRYWEIIEELRDELGYVDYLGALGRYRLENPHRADLVKLANWLIDYPFASQLYPDSLAVVRHVSQWGTPVILSDGDAVFQPRKVFCSGLMKAFEDRVLIYVHKEKELDDVERLYPADHYILIDDKLRILSAVKRAWGDRVTTIFPKQGHYAFEPGLDQLNPQADIEIERISDLLDEKTMSEVLRKWNESSERTDAGRVRADSTGLRLNSLQTGNFLGNLHATTRDSAD